MTLDDLLEIVGAAYPDDGDGMIGQTWNKETQTAEHAGDTLALFLVRELAATFDADKSDYEQLWWAASAVRNAEQELTTVAEALEKAVSDHRSHKEEPG